MRRWWSPSSSARWRRFSRGASTSGSGGRRAPTRTPLRALRRDLQTNAEQFPQDVLELRAYFDEVQPGQQIRAVPGMGLKVPLWILGSSLFGAQVAAVLGLPFAFASHFAPEALMPALEIYRRYFKPSEQLDKPMRWWRPTSSPRTPMPRRAICSLRCSSRS